MDARVLQNPFTKSTYLHLLLLLLFSIYEFYGPKTLIGNDESISVQILDAPKQNLKTSTFEGEKNRIVKENISSEKQGMFSNRRVISVKDLGVKIDSAQIRPDESIKNWSEDGVGDDVEGGRYITGLKQGETSALNTKENIFFSYTNRMRGQLYQNWAPIIRKELERFYGMGFTFTEDTYFITRTKIILNAEGKVVKVQLLQDSGVLDLDNAALTALNKAGPYPNPPKGLINADGKAELEWNFILRN